MTFELFRAATQELLKVFGGSRPFEVVDQRRERRLHRRTTFARKPGKHLVEADESLE